jgi:hypothetical protein
MCLDVAERHASACRSDSFPDRDLRRTFGHMRQRDQRNGRQRRRERDRLTSISLCTCNASDAHFSLARPVLRWCWRPDLYRESNPMFHSASSTLLALLAALSMLGDTWRPSPQARPEKPRVNRCGCYEESPGVCKCRRNSSCGCPGQCEPLGCEEKRQKDLARRMEEELKRIRDDERERNQSKPTSEVERPDGGGDAESSPENR